MPKLTDTEKEQRRLERADRIAAEAAERRAAKENQIHAGIVARLDAKIAEPDVYRLFEYMHKQALDGRLDESLRSIHIRQEGLR